jgi:hypothetical protein
MTQERMTILEFRASLSMGLADHLSQRIQFALHFLELLFGDGFCGLGVNQFQE